MPTPVASYSPPTSDAIARRQNDLNALRLLLAQRRQYTRAKRWQTIRWIGLLALGIGAPFISILLPTAAAAVGATAGAWIFASRTGLAWLETRSMTRAACMQEALDLYIFNMPTTIVRREMPLPEDVAALAGSDSRLQARARAENLTDWYDIDASAPGVQTVAVAQRSNAAYTDRLIRTVVSVWATAGLAWLAFLIVWAAVAGTSLTSFLLGVALPVLPAFLDVAEYVLSTWKAHRDRADLANTIAARMSGVGQPMTGADLLVWQDTLFDLRRMTPQVPNWLYKVTRRRNEMAMRASAAHLRASAGAGGPSSPGSQL